MDRKFIANRITDLRLKEDMSEYQLSMELGKSKTYINNISSGKTLPSLIELINICDYFDIELKDFFDEENGHPVVTSEILRHLKKLDQSDLQLVEDFIKRLLK